MPSIIAYVRNGSTAVPVASNGVPVPFENEHFVGSVFFAHQSAGDRNAFAYSERLLKSDCQWEIQIQGRFKIAPQGPLCCGGQLPDMPFGLGNMFKSVCGMTLKDVKLKRSQDSADMLYMSMMHSDRLCRSYDPISLPVSHPGSKGTWHWVGTDDWGEWQSENWRWASFDTECYYAFSFSSPFIDWDSWKATKIPGVGSFEFQKFWGRQGCSVKLSDDHNCFVQLDFLPPVARKVQEYIKPCVDECVSSNASTSSDVSDCSSEFGAESWSGGDSQFTDDEEEADDVRGSATSSLVFSAESKCSSTRICIDTIGALLSRASSNIPDSRAECKLVSTRGSIDEMAELVCLAATHCHGSNVHHATPSTRAYI